MILVAVQILLQVATVNTEMEHAILPGRYTVMGVGNAIEDRPLVSHSPAPYQDLNRTLMDDTSDKEAINKTFLFYI